MRNHVFANLVAPSRIIGETVPVEAALDKIAAASGCAVSELEHRMEAAGAAGRKAVENFKTAFGQN